MPKKIENELKEQKIVKKNKLAETKNTTKKTKTIEKSKEIAKAKATEKTAKKSIKTKGVDKKIISKKLEDKKSTTKKITEKKSKQVAKIEKPKKQEYLQEYYDLPYRYNETVVTILAQTPKRLFVYWDISDKDRETYKKAFGDDFFEKTYPVLLVHNEELNYTFEVPINDFANSWYLDIKDSKKNYVVQLGRKFKNIEQVKVVDTEVLEEEKINLQNDFVYITDSNKLEIPNDHILFEHFSNKVMYRNVKNGNEYEEELKSLVNDSNKTYPAEIVHELYTKLYSEEIAKEEFGRKNPGSGELGLPTSSGALRSSGQW